MNCPSALRSSLCVLMLSCGCVAAPAAEETHPVGSAKVLFGPTESIGRHTVDFIDGARQRVWLAGYTFTLPAVAQALARAHARGVEVRVLVDASQVTQAYSVVTYLRNHSVPVWVDRRHAIMHHKFVIVDHASLALGSANFTKAGMGGPGVTGRVNAENFNLFTGVPGMVGAYAKEFSRLVAIAEVAR